MKEQECVGRSDAHWRIMAMNEQKLQATFPWTKEIVFNESMLVSLFVLFWSMPVE